MLIWESKMIDEVLQGNMFGFFWWSVKQIICQFTCICHLGQLLKAGYKAVLLCFLKIPSFDKTSVTYVILKNVFPHIKTIKFKRMHSLSCIFQVFFFYFINIHICSFSIKIAGVAGNANSSGCECAVCHPCSILQLMV